MPPQSLQIFLCDTNTYPRSWVLTTGHGAPPGSAHVLARPRRQQESGHSIHNTYSNPTRDDGNTLRLAEHGDNTKAGGVVRRWSSGYFKPRRWQPTREQSSKPAPATVLFRGCCWVEWGPSILQPSHPCSEHLCACSLWTGSGNSLAGGAGEGQRAYIRVEGCKGHRRRSKGTNASSLDPPKLILRMVLRMNSPSAKRHTTYPYIPI